MTSSATVKRNVGATGLEEGDGQSVPPIHQAFLLLGGEPVGRPCLSRVFRLWMGLSLLLRHPRAVLA